MTDAEKLQTLFQISKLHTNEDAYTYFNHPITFDTRGCQFKLNIFDSNFFLNKKIGKENAYFTGKSSLANEYLVGHTHQVPPNANIIKQDYGIAFCSKYGVVGTSCESTCPTSFSLNSVEYLHKIESQCSDRGQCVGTTCNCAIDASNITEYIQPDCATRDCQFDSTGERCSNGLMDPGTP